MNLKRCNVFIIGRGVNAQLLVDYVQMIYICHLKCNTVLVMLMKMLVILQAASLLHAFDSFEPFVITENVHRC